MKILVVSDSHRNNENLFRVIEQEKPIDMLIHCGDAEGTEYIIGMKAECPMEIVLGNNDFFSELPREKEFQIGRYKIWLTHGHYYYVSMGPERIVEEAEEKGVDIVIFGHTHRPLLQQEGSLTVLNPGSISYPRQEGRKPSYAIMEYSQDEQMNISIRYLNNESK